MSFIVLLIQTKNIKKCWGISTNKISLENGKSAKDKII